MDKDSDQLRLLSVFHYVVGGLLGLFACFPIIHLIIGLFLVSMPERTGFGSSQPPHFVGWIFIVVAVGIILIGWSVATLVIWAGRCLSRRCNYNFCFVMACIMCAFMPFGTVLGIFSIIVLMRPSVKLLFGNTATA